ncbi:related to theta class glutathione S-transferase [Phialocephala subalpina]|uniref:Related to theta class glutathione S-transferase n=1 Tax=Phialocephala subalpina TaxID=576137 RepID=A0A1L7XVU4_9HELO|nr:related to theta class glutathione S-transferase [Phialocephala subalpina]
MAEKITFYSHRQGPNPWKSVTVFEELEVPYQTIYLEFGKVPNGVEDEGFLNKNPAGRVPLIYDPATGNTSNSPRSQKVDRRRTGVPLTESNTIALYLVDQYDKDAKLTFRTTPEKYLVSQWLYLQGATQAPMFQQALLFALGKNNPEAQAHLRGIVKRTLATIDTALDGKTYLVGDKCTIADLAFVNWDLTLDVRLKGDPEAALREQRKALYPNRWAWHHRILERPAVKKMIQTQKEANPSS